MTDAEERQQPLPSMSINPIPELWDLPPEVLFLVVSYVAATTRRASVVCHTLACLAKEGKRALLEDETRCGFLWEIILREDYQ